MTGQDATIVCVCGNRGFYAFADGADSYLIECTSCGRRGEISAGRGMTLSLVELPDEPAPAGDAVDRDKSSSS